uniref:DUF4371 domain-containing protein n=1 Tax=Kalanchoe fedtschenkoi TaxID=63787 RepID=A0A7N0TZT5_KALFE
MIFVTKVVNIEVLDYLGILEDVNELFEIYRLFNQKKIENLIKSQQGALDEFVVKESQVPIESENINTKLDVNEDSNDNNSKDHNDNEDNVFIHSFGSTDNIEDLNDDDIESLNFHIDIFDPRCWDALDSKMFDVLAVKGHIRDKSIQKGPKKNFKRRFVSDLYVRILDNEHDKVFYFCCKIFKKEYVKGGLVNKGYDDWAHVEFLAKHSLAFRGIKERLYENNNGNFLGLGEMLAKFDPIIQEHLGHKIQNELIFLLASSIRSEIVKKITQAKYFSVILDCAADELMFLDLDVDMCEGKDMTMDPI